VEAEVGELAHELDGECHAHEGSGKAHMPRSAKTEMDEEGHATVEAQDERGELGQEVTRVRVVGGGFK